MLLENHRCRHRCFQTVSLASLHNLAKRTHRTAAAFPVVRHQRQPTLHLRRCVQTLNEIPFFGGEDLPRWRSIHVKSNSRSHWICQAVRIRSPSVREGGFAKLPSLTVGLLTLNLILTSL